MTLSRQAQINAEIQRRIRARSRHGAAKRSLMMAVVGGVVLFSAGWIWSPSEEVTYSSVIVSPSSMLQRKPPIIITRWTGRIRWREIKPQQVAVAPAAAESVVHDFCRSSELAQMLGATEQTIRFWELDKTKPIHKYMPKVIQFLGYDPFPVPKTLSERLKRYRLMHGLTQRELAKKLRVSPDALRDWEADRHKPTGRSVKVLNELGLVSPASD